MGKINTEPKKEAPSLSTHFSHPHPLNKLITEHHQTLIHSPSSCSGCNLKPSGIIYSCTTCNFFLHKKCFEMPKKITHPFHKEHTLTLLPEPAYPSGFVCDACTERGKGFSYHCEPCGVDLHILCAIMPLTLTSASHQHKLDLTFGSPYPTKNFNCDVCSTNGGDHWLYRCGPCGFDAHLKCARKQSHQGGHTSSRSTPAPPQQQGFGPGPHVPHSFGPHLPGMVNPALGYPAGGGMGVNMQNEMLLQALQQMISQNHAMTQMMLQPGGGLGGAGLGGGDAGLRQLMQVMNALNGNGGGIPGLGGLGGGGLDLQSLLGGGGGGLDLQSLLGGGGLDFLGGGGFDLGGLLGGFGLF